MPIAGMTPDPRFDVATEHHPTAQIDLGWRWGLPHAIAEPVSHPETALGRIASIGAVAMLRRASRVADTTHGSIAVLTMHLHPYPCLCAYQEQELLCADSERIANIHTVRLNTSVAVLNH